MPWELRFLTSLRLIKNLTRLKKVHFPASSPLPPKRLFKRSVPGGCLLRGPNWSLNTLLWTLLAPTLVLSTHFSFYSLYGEFLPFLAAISHPSIQCDKPGDHGRVATAACVFKFPNGCFFKCQLYGSLEFLVTYLLHPSPSIYRTSLAKQNKPNPDKLWFPLLDKYFFFSSLMEG